MCCNGVMRFISSNMSRLHKLETITMPGKLCTTNPRALHNSSQCAHYWILTMQLVSAEAACISSMHQLPSLVQHE